MAYGWRTEQFIHFWSEKKKKRKKGVPEYTHTHTNEAKEQAKLLSSGRPSALEQFLEELMPPAVTPTSAALLVRLPHNDESD